MNLSRVAGLGSSRPSSAVKRLNLSLGDNMLKHPRGKSEIGPFSIVPEWILLNAPPNALRVWCLLCRYANHEDAAWPSQETMADTLDISVATIQRGLRDLAEIGAIEINAVHDGMKRNNLYFLKPSIPKATLQKCGVRHGKNDVFDTANLPQERESLERDSKNDTGFPEKSRALLRETLERVR